MNNKWYSLKGIHHFITTLDDTESLIAHSSIFFAKMKQNE